MSIQTRVPCIYGQILQVCENVFTAPNLDHKIASIVHQSDHDSADFTC